MTYGRLQLLMQIFNWPAIPLKWRYIWLLRRTGVFSRPDDLACVIEHGAIPVALTDHLDAWSALPSACRVHANLAAFVDALIEEPGPDA